jgi:hypothetical protein
MDTNAEPILLCENDQVRLRPENEQNLPKDATDGTVVATVERIEEIDGITCYRVYWLLAPGLRCYSSIDASRILEVNRPMAQQSPSNGSAEPLLPQGLGPVCEPGQKGIAMTTQEAATKARRYDLDDEQAMQAPLTIDVWPEEREYVGERPQEEIATILQEGAALSLYVAQDEYCIEWKGEQFVFEVWHDEATRTYTQPYDSLELLLQAEKSRPSFDLSAFELIA